jgi:hypothetical protein
MRWNFDITAAGAQQTLTRLRGHFSGMFNEMSSGITNSITKFNAYQVALDFCIDAGKQLIKESRELIAISSKYDIPISKMGSLQMMANMTGQSVGQLARGFRFLEMNMGRALLKPGGPQYQAFKELGITQEQMTAASKDTMYALELVRGKVMNITDENRRNAFLQEIFGANWQNVLPIIEQSVTAQKDATSAGYEYSSSMTESLSTMATSMEEIGQDVKPIVMPIVQLLSMLTTILAALIEGLKLMIILVGKTLYAAFQAIVGIVQGIVAGVAKVIQAIQYVATFGSSGKKGGVMDNIASGFGNAAVDSFKGAGGEFTSMGKHINKSAREQQKMGDRFVRNTYAFGESIGVTDEGSYLKDALNEYKNIEKQQAKNKAQTIELTKQWMDMKKYSSGTSYEIEQIAKMEEKLNDLSEEGVGLTEDKKRLSEAIERASGKVPSKNADANGITPRTAEERKIEIQKGRQARERGIKEAMANTPIGMQMETAFEVVKAYEEIKKLEEDLAELEKNNSDDIQKRADLENSIANSKITLIEKQRAHENFMQKMTREREDSEKSRKDDMIKAMQEREQQFMTRQGMTGMDKQSTVVSNAIEQMQRDQEQLNKVMNDPKRTQQERLEAQKKFEGSTMGAMKEFDKLSLMQFQYSASDAAKKGMGGGVDIRENTLTVAKSQLEYLRKSYEIQLKQFGLSPDQFGNVPFQMQGPMRGGK